MERSPHASTIPVTAPVEVCVLSYGSAAVLGPCLDSLAAIPGPVRVAVREHATGTESRAVLEQRAPLFSGTRWEHDPTNPGFAVGCNALAEASTAHWLLFLNPDARIVAWPWTPVPTSPALIGAWIEGDGSPDRHFGRSWRVRDEMARSWLRRGTGAPAGTGFVSGAAMLVERGTFGALGGFDEGFFMYYEDVDLGRRAGELGTPVVADERFRVEHDGGHAAGRAPGVALLRSYHSAVRLRDRQSDPLRAYLLYVVVDAGLRCLLALVRRRTGSARGYGAVIGAALRDLARGPQAPTASRQAGSQAR